jgi:molybdate transport system regulatory protein
MEFKIKSRIWIESNNHILLGEGRVALLKEIEQKGSLSKAAKSLGISYKKSWNLIDSVNKSSKKNVITTTVGGKNGGGAELTEYGKKLVAVFDEINQSCWKHLDQQLHKLENL